MKRGKFEQPRPVKPARKGLGVKTAGVLLSAALLFGCAVGGTLAWLKDETDPVKNTFTSSNIDITLTETDTDPYTEGMQYNYKMIPGHTITKDPKVTVLAGSEDCYLFVKIVESTNFDDFMTYTVADGWTALNSVDGVYYRLVSSATTAQGFAVIKDNKVTVKTDVTKAMMDDLDNGTAAEPTLTFTAYAIQFENGQTETWSAADAWAKIGTP